MFKDFEYWKEWETKLAEALKQFWRTIEQQSSNSILDFKLFDWKWKEVLVELKTRKVNKDEYPDTMIGLNKLIEAYKRYDEAWIYTLFVFQFKDWIYWVNPFFVLPRFDHLKWRWDRWGFDKVKGYIYYPTEELKPLIEKFEKA